VRLRHALEHAIERRSESSELLPEESIGMILRGEREVGALDRLLFRGAVDVEQRVVVVPREPSIERFDRRLG
jgi:hypothetical protein